MHSMGLKDEGPSCEDTLVDMRARSPGVQLDLLSTSGNTMSETEGKGGGEVLSVNESVSGSEEPTRNTSVDFNCGESSAADDNEEVRTRQVYEGAKGSTR